MADEEEQHHEEHEDAELDETAEPGDDADVDGATSEDDEAERGGEAQQREEDAGGDDADDRVGFATIPPTREARNAAVIGTVTLHYAARDVRIPIDGASALRMLSMYRSRREGGLDDPLSVAGSSAWSGWVVWDLDEPLAMSWMPRLPERPRTAIDPELAAS